MIIIEKTHLEQEDNPPFAQLIRSVCELGAEGVVGPAREEKKSEERKKKKVEFFCSVFEGPLARKDKRGGGGTFPTHFPPGGVYPPPS